MHLLAAITVVILALGYWSSYARIAKLGGVALPVVTKMIMAAVGLVCAIVAATLITSPGLGVIIAEFFVLCFGQTLGYILSGK